MIFFPPSKINIGLNVLGKRDDGYHEISTCMYPIPLYDVLEIVPSESLEFTSSGLEINGPVESNLCLKAYHLLAADYDIDPVKIHLIKKIPMGAGLGGGSADGAYTLKALNELFELGINNSKLKEYAAQLGSDCPFFIENFAQLATGRGELLKSFDLDLSGMFLKLVNPGIHVGTAEAYANVTFSPDPDLTELLSDPINTWKESVTNSFEDSVFDSYPTVGTIKEDLYEEGALYSSMSGSGSTVYGLFENRPSDSYKNHFCKVVEL